MHILLAIAADVVDVDVEHMGILFNLAPGYRHQAIPVFAVQQLAHLLGATGIEPLTNDQKRVVLVIRRGAVNRSRRGFSPQQGALLLCLRRTHRPFRWGHLLGQLSQGSDVGWRGAATTTNHLNPEVFDEVVHRHLHLHRCQAVVGNAAHVFRQACIGNATHHKGSVRAEVSHVLFHLLGARGAIEAQHINGEGFENGHHSGNIRAHQHRAGGFHRHADHHRPALTSGRKGLLQACQGGLDLQRVLAGFDDEEIHIAGKQATGLLGKGIAHGIETHVPQGGQLGGGAHGAGHKARLLWGAVAIGHLAGQLSRFDVELVGLVLQVVFGQHQ